jgi:hypothetical protein
MKTTCEFWSCNVEEESQKELRTRHLRPLHNYRAHISRPRASSAIGVAIGGVAAYLINNRKSGRKS